MSRVDKLNSILRRLQTDTPDIEASALISEDGLMIASVLPQYAEEGRVAGMSTTIFSLGSRASRELERGGLKQVLVRGDEGYAIMVVASSGSVLLVLTTKEAKLGLIFLDMGRAVEQIKQVL